jgi:hypothetical protein
MYIGGASWAFVLKEGLHLEYALNVVLVLIGNGGVGRRAELASWGASLLCPSNWRELRKVIDHLAPKWRTLEANLRMDAHVEQVAMVL